MELRTIFRIAPLAFIIVGAALFAMQHNTGSQVIKVITNDDQITEIPKDIALKSSTLANAVQDLGESDEPLPLPNISNAQLMPIIQILKQLDDADQSKLKRSDGAYIAQRIQPIIDQNLAGTCQQAALVARAAEYLDLGYIANGAIRYMIQKTLPSNPMLTVDNLEIQCFGNQPIPHNLNPILEYQYLLVKNDDIPELSIADYIAINRMPKINDGILKFSRRNITSLEGLTLIPGITNLTDLDLSYNILTTIPANTFNGLTNLQNLNLSYNILTTIPANTFNGLTNLKNLNLSYNILTTIPANAFNGLTNLKNLHLSHTPLTTISANTFNGLTNLKNLYLFKTPIPQTMNKDVFRNQYNIPATTAIEW